MTAVVNKTLGTLSEITWDIITMSVFFAWTLLQLFVVYFFAATDSKEYFKYLDSLKIKKKKKATDEISPVLPISKFIDFRNPLQRSALKMSIFICGIKILTRVISEFFSPIPSSIVEVLVMIAAYLFDLLYGVLAYVIALIVFNVIYDILKTKKADEDNAPSAKEV